MVSFNSPSAVAVISFVAMIQPSLSASVAVRLGTSLLTSAIGNSGNKNSRSETVPQQLQSGFADCLNKLHEVPPTMIYNNDKTVVMGHLPEVCIQEVHAYNNQTNIKALEKTQGRTTVINSTAIHLDSMPGDLHTLLESQFGPPGTAKGLHHGAKDAKGPKENKSASGKAATAAKGAKKAE
jgi:hypothetical protein